MALLARQERKVQQDQQEIRDQLVPLVKRAFQGEQVRQEILDLLAPLDPLGPQAILENRDLLDLLDLLDQPEPTELAPRSSAASKMSMSTPPTTHKRP